MDQVVLALLQLSNQWAVLTDIASQSGAAYVEKVYVEPVFPQSRRLLFHK